MAETRKITIEIVTTEKKEESSTPTQNVEETKESGFNLRKLLHPIKNLEKATVGKNVFLNQAYQQAKQMIVKTFNTSINRYFSLSEDYMSENSYNQVSTMISKGTSLGTAIVSGAIVGGVGGAVVSTIGWAASEFIQNQASLSSYHQSLNAANYQASFSGTRAGLVDNGRGTEN